MKFVANRINQVHLRDLLPVISEEVQIDGVLAAIAYGSSSANEAEDLLGHALANKLRLDLWMRYDHKVPVAVPFLKRLLRHLPDNVFTNFVPDCFHAKVIWWKGYGAYIGSANHTDRGWLSNIEAGMFVSEDELLAGGMDQELEKFFDYLRELDKTIPISADYIAEQERLSALNRDNFRKAEVAREHPEWQGPTFVEKKKAFDRRKENFKKEWLNALGILGAIQQKMNDFRPVWLKEDVPEAWQVDQFLHAFYYNRVGERLHKPYEDYFQNNRKDPNGTLLHELDWWASLPSAPSQEDNNLYHNAPLIRNLLQPGKILELTSEEFESICRNTHATMDHVIKIPTAVLGRPDISTMSRDERMTYFAPLLMNERNKKGWDIRQLLDYVLDGGPAKEIWERLYYAGRDPEYTIPRYGLNSLAEVAGWARPQVAPPRNGRTSKALRALGFDVKVY